MAGQPAQQLRLAEVVSSLCLATDLASGQPLEHGLKRALLAVWLGIELGFTREELREVYYVALLGTVGCVLESAALARYIKDDIAFGEQIVLRDPTRPMEVAAFVLGQVGQGESPLSRARKVVTTALAGHNASLVICRDVALQIGDFLNLGPAVGEAVGQCHEHWNGKGGPRRLKGEEIHHAARVFVLAHDAEIFDRVGGVEVALKVVRDRDSKVYDPELAALFLRVGPALLTRLHSVGAWDAVLEMEPAPQRLLSGAEFDEIALTLAHFVDMRSAYTLGHSPGVAVLAESGARALGLSQEEALGLRHAGLLHDLGRAGVPVALWESRRPLSPDEWERMKRHPSLTELVLARSTALGGLGTLAGLHHERMDATGYRSLSAASQPLTARVLAVADAFQSKLEPRPHRDDFSPEAAAAHLRREARQGRLDREAVEAVLADQPSRPQPKPHERPWGLTEREIEVLSLAVRGLSNREIAEALVVAPKTVGNHIQNIYEKIGVSTRVGATLFALHHGLVQDITAIPPPESHR